MAPGRAIDETESIRIAAIFLAFIVITLLFEKFSHYLEHHLQGRTRRGLRAAVHHIEEELLALGLISFLLIVAEEYVLKICVDNPDYDPNKYKSDGYGGGYGGDYAEDEKGGDSTSDYENESEGYDSSYGGRRLLFGRRLQAGYGSSCESDEEPFWSANALHQTHLFIFMVAVIHISYATASILICLWRMRRWKKYEDRPDHRLKELKNAKLIYGRNTFDYWFWSFWAQFSPAVDESLYLSMRCLFIERMEFPDDFNFLSFVVNTLVEEFANVVRIDWTMWVTAAIWILVPEFLLVTTAAAVLLVLILGTKLEVVGIKLTQLAYLAYGDRKSARTRRVMAPNTLIRDSVSYMANRLSRYSTGSQSGEERPDLGHQSLSMKNFGSLSKSQKSLRRVQSFEERSVRFEDAVRQGQAAENSEAHPEATTAEIADDGERSTKSMPQVDAQTKTNRFWEWLTHLRGGHHDSYNTFSDRYSLPDSANLFWFQQPQLILKALRFVYFETAMAIAVVAFNAWQDVNFITEYTDYIFSNDVLIMVVLIAVGVLCLVHASFLMLPTYALTMVAGSHCPEGLLNTAKKMKVELAQVKRIENLEDGESAGQRRGTDRNPPHGGHADHHGESHGHGEESDEKVISSLIGAMYKGRMQRMVKRASATMEVVSELIENDERRKSMGPAAGSGGSGLGQNGEPSKDIRAADDEEMRGIIAFFGSFEKFLHELHNAQEGLKQMIPNAVFNFDTSTASYFGRESTSYDRAAINLTWDLFVAQQDDLPDDDM